MRKQKEAQELFNFSFVDILATTIGVLIFIMVMVILNSVNRVSPEDVKKKQQEVEVANQALEKELKEMEEKVREEINRKKTLETAMTEGPASFFVVDKNVQEKHKEELDRKNQELRTKLEKARAEEKEVREQLKETAINPQAKKSTPKQVVFRVPEERETNKKPIVLECDGNRVYVMATGGNLNESDYNATNFGVFIQIDRKSGAAGETLEEIRKPGSKLMKTLQACDKNQCYAIIVIRQNSFVFFRNVRDVLWKAGWDLTWDAMKDGVPILVPTGGGGGKGTVM